MLINGRNFYFLFYGYYLADIPAAVWVHYEYLHCTHPHTATQRIRLDLPQMKCCERLAHITNYIFAQEFLPCKARWMVFWKGACGKHIEESVKVEDVLSWGEGVCEEKPLRLVIGKCSQPTPQGPFLKWKPSRPVKAVIGSNAGPKRGNSNEQWTFRTIYPSKAILYHSLEPIESQKTGHSFTQLLGNAPSFSAHRISLPDL